jgi:hypothetical protein
LSERAVNAASSGLRRVVGFSFRHVKAPGCAAIIVFDKGHVEKLFLYYQRIVAVTIIA